MYPPCNTTAFSRIPIDNPKQNIIVSFAQFRPEKDQSAQLKAFFEFHKRNCELNAHFYMIGNFRKS